MSGGLGKSSRINQSSSVSTGTVSIVLMSQNDEKEEHIKQRTQSHNSTMTMSSPTKSSRSSHDNNATARSDMIKRNSISVFVIAHPDDESMFFVPTITAISSKDGTCCWLLCLSNGNYDGLGKQREDELKRVGRHYLHMDRVIVIDDPLLQDSPTARWPEEAISKVLEEQLLTVVRDTTNISTAVATEQQQQFNIYTFDSEGVSGHINHKDTYLGVQYFLGKQRHDTTRATIRAYELVTVTNVFQKYLPLWHWMVLFLHTFLNGSLIPLSEPRTDPDTVATLHYTLYQPWVNWKCMAGHASQFVWYRRLFVIFSCYTYENRWKVMHGS